jgi:hypothetical protein
MKWASSLVTAFVLGFMAIPAQAAPATGIAGDLKSIAGEGADVEQVRHGCYRHRGHWHCPPHRYRRYYGPDVRFYSGPRRHHHHWRHHHH